MEIPSEKIYEYPLDKYLKPQQKPMKEDNLILKEADTTAASLDKLLSRATSVLKDLDMSKSFNKPPRKVKLSEPFGFDEQYDEETNVREIVDAKINGNIIVSTTCDKKEKDGNLKKIAEIYDREMDDLINKFVKNFKTPVAKESVALPSPSDTGKGTKKIQRIVTELKNLKPPSLQRCSNELIEIKSYHQNANKLAIRKLPSINIKPGLTEQKIPAVEILPTEIPQKVITNVAVVTCKDSKGEKSVYEKFKMCEDKMEKTRENDEMVCLFENKPRPGPSRTETDTPKLADYVPYSKLTVGGVSIDELQDEINKLYGDNVSADLPISPIVQKILSEKSNNTEDYADDFDDKSSTVEDALPGKSATNLSIKTSTDVFDFVHNRDVRDGATQSNVARVQKETQTSTSDNEFGTQTSPSKAKGAMTSPARNADALTSPAFKIRNAEQQTSPFVSERTSELKLVFPTQSTDAEHSDDLSVGEIALDFKKISDKYRLETRSRSSDSCTSVSSSSVAAIRMNGKSDGEMSVSHGRIF